MISQMKSALLAGSIIAGFCAAAGVPAAAAELDGNALLNADKDPNNWVMYHQSYKSWHYSPLDQINAGNVKDLKLLWIHTPGAGKRGIQSFPLAIDGTNGAFLWTFKPKLDEERAQGTVYNPYNRGLAAGYGKLYLGTLDGHLIAVDMQTG